MSLTLYSAAQTREFDRVAIEEAGVPGFELMQRAGRAAFATLIDRWPSLQRLSVCCGKGNNAGDGYLIGGLAAELGISVQLLQLGDPAELTGDAALARDWAAARSVSPEVCKGGLPAFTGEVIVDALLGTGLSGAPRGAYAQAIDAINAAGQPVLAVDIPSGISADTGGAAGSAVQADLTVTFIARKLGCFTGVGVAACGELHFADLGVGADIMARQRGVPLLELESLLARDPLPERTANAYKHALGHVLVVGGDHAMGGAPLLAAEAALRVGAGMVTVVTRAGHRPAILARRPEIMVVDADDQAARDAAYDRAHLLVVGPGLGRTDWGSGLLGQALAIAKPMVLDADGLNRLIELNAEVTAPTVVTPHAAEAAALLSTSVADIALDRPAAALALAAQVATGGCGVSVVKGAGTVIAEHSGESGQLLGICSHGNPGMASAGMGDVLSGVIGGLMAQGLAPGDATRLGVCLHSCAADAAVKQTGQRGLLAGDLIPQMMQLLK